eukprot:3413153-Prymnesium_polylepis.1
MHSRYFCSLSHHLRTSDLAWPSMISPTLLGAYPSQPGRSSNLWGGCLGSHGSSYTGSLGANSSSFSGASARCSPASSRSAGTPASCKGCWESAHTARYSPNGPVPSVSARRRSRRPCSALDIS